MTTGDLPRLAAAAEPPEPAVPDDDVLIKLQEGALRLLGGLDRPPTSLRMRAGGVEIELEWPDPRPPAPVVAALPAAPAGPAPAAVAAVAAVAAAPEPAAPPTTERYVTAHMVGTFYRAPQPGAKPFAEPGDTIRPGQQIGIIEAMKLSIPVEADAAGRVVEMLVADGAPVEFGDKLLSYEPSG
jgi:acetyl-CoA carboxylase biotin carboxyl carrier protein